MTQEDYQLYTFFKPEPAPKTQVKEQLPVYIGSGEDACLETYQQLVEKKEAHAVFYS
jgi:hypothetical protein